MLILKDWLVVQSLKWVGISCSTSWTIVYYDLKISNISEAHGVNRSTIKKRLEEYGISISERKTDITDTELDCVVRNIQRDFPNAAYRRMQSPDFFVSGDHQNWWSPVRLVLSRQGVGDLPTQCSWSTDFAGDLPTFAGEFPSSLVIYRLLLVSYRQLVTSRRFGDLPIFSWWCPDFFYLCLLYWC